MMGKTVNFFAFLCWW